MQEEKLHDGGEYAQYLTFHSADNAYAVEILRVKEIIPYSGSTSVPLAPKVVRGLINLRGNAVAVIDLAVRFGAPPTEASRRTCVVIVDVAAGDDDAVMGILADSVSEVIDLHSSQIDETPSFGVGVASDFLDGLARVGDHFVPIINVETVLAPNEALAAVFPELDNALVSATQANEAEVEAADSTDPTEGVDGAEPCETDPEEASD